MYHHSSHNLLEATFTQSDSVVIYFAPDLMDACLANVLIHSTGMPCLTCTSEGRRESEVRDLQLLPSSGLLRGVCTT
jgi:hypothetical protein